MAEDKTVTLEKSYPVPDSIRERAHIKSVEQYEKMLPEY